jgi:hypothetical protein
MEGGEKRVLGGISTKLNRKSRGEPPMLKDVIEKVVLNRLTTELTIEGEDLHKLTRKLTNDTNKIITDILTQLEGEVEGMEKESGNETWVIDAYNQALKDVLTLIKKYNKDAK